MRTLFLWLRRSAARLGATLRPRAQDEEFRVELEAHRQLIIDESIARGMPEELARCEAARRLGGLAQLEEAHREWRGLAWLEHTARDFHSACRSLRRDRAFLLATVGVIALGIGATTAVFTLVERLFCRALPYADERQLVSVGITLPWVQQEFLFGRLYAQLRDQLASQEAQGALPVQAVTSMLGVLDCETGGAAPAAQRLACAQVEWTFLSVLGMRPALGADFSEADDQPEAPAVALLSHSLWTTGFGANPAIIGTSAMVNGRPTVIRGVLPPEFELPTGEHADLLIPQRADWRKQSVANPGAVFRVFARLESGADARRATQSLQPLFDFVAGSAPAHTRKDMGLRVRPVRDLHFRDAQLASWLLLASAGAIFLITCGNASFLLLARAASRRRERAIRLALGAGPVRLIRQTLAEALLIALPGGLLGCGLAFMLLRLVTAVLPATLMPSGQAMPGLHAVALALTAAMAAAALFGLAPLFVETTPAPLNTPGTAGSSPRSRRLRQALVVSQIALCLVLLTGAVAMLRTLWQLRNESSGLRASRIIAASFVLSRERYTNTERQKALFAELEDRLRGAPGVEAVAIADSVPPSGITRSQPIAALTMTGLGGAPTFSGGGIVIWRFVTQGYFDVLGIPVIQGRGFVANDLHAGPVVVVNEALARRLFPGSNAIARSILVSGGPLAEIVGVARDVRNGNAAGPPDPEYYVLRQSSAASVYGNQMPPHGWRRASVLVRSSLPPAVVQKMLRAEITVADPGIDVAVETMHERFEGLREQPRFHAVVLGCFGLTGLLLAAAGLCGLVAFLSAERVQEFSVRIALGAGAGHIERLVLSLALRWVALGGIVGALLALAASRALRSMAYGVSGVDPLDYLAALAVLGVVCVVSAWQPARRAGTADPLNALRTQ